MQHAFIPSQQEKRSSYSILIFLIPPFGCPLPWMSGAVAPFATPSAHNWAEVTKNLWRQIETVIFIFVFIIQFFSLLMLITLCVGCRDLNLIIQLQTCDSSSKLFDVYVQSRNGRFLEVVCGAHVQGLLHASGRKGFWCLCSFWFDRETGCYIPVA